VFFQDCERRLRISLVKSAARARMVIWSGGPL
jgi:hypothetical protein